MDKAKVGEVAAEIRITTGRSRTKARALNTRANTSGARPVKPLRVLPAVAAHNNRRDMT